MKQTPESTADYLDRHMIQAMKELAKEGFIRNKKQNMPPKEKAKDLVNKFEYQEGYGISESTGIDGINFHQAKQCALIAVEFARQEFRDHCCAEMGTDGSPDDHFDAIKQEIEKL
jgi:hypothetical protein